MPIRTDNALSFLSLIDQLAVAPNKTEKKRLSNELSKLLSLDVDYSALVLRNIVYNIFRSNDELKAILEGDFFKLRHKPYVDDDKLTKVAIGVAYLQDYRDFNDDLDNQVALALVREIQKLNLDLVFNDITVNLSHIRNSEVGSLL